MSVAASARGTGPSPAQTPPSPSPGVKRGGFRNTARLLLYKIKPLTVK